MRLDAWTLLRLVATACVLLATAVLTMLMSAVPSRGARQRLARGTWTNAPRTGALGQ